MDDRINLLTKQIEDVRVLLNNSTSISETAALMDVIDGLTDKREALVSARNQRTNGIYGTPLDIDFSNAPIFQSPRAQAGATRTTPGTTTTSNTNNPMIDIEPILKERHLRKEERDSLHNPCPDWTETGKGEVCKNACTLEISDIVTKIKKVTK